MSRRDPFATDEEVERIRPYIEEQRRQTEKRHLQNVSDLQEKVGLSEDEAHAYLFYRNGPPPSRSKMYVLGKRATEKVKASGLSDKEIFGDCYPLIINY